MGYDGGHDRARHGRGDGHLAPRDGARFRPQDRRRRARGGAGERACEARLSGRARRDDGRGRMTESALDTLPKLLLHNAAMHGDDIAMREKQLGIWRPFTWRAVAERTTWFALGLRELGIGRGDVVGLIGDNRPDWVMGELAAHAVGAMSLGIYRDALEQEAAYLIGFADVKLVFAEDEEQVDKLLGLGEQIGSVARIVYSDPRGIRKYDDPRLISAADLVALGRARAVREPGAFAALVAAGKGDDVAVLCTTSGTTAHPKLAMLTGGAIIRHCRLYHEVDPRGPDDEYVSVLPLPWIMEQIYALGEWLVFRLKVNFVEEPETLMQDFREIGPTFVLFAPRVWEASAADGRARMMDASTLKRGLFEVGMKL